MPMTTKKGNPRTTELPETLQRSPRSAQKTFAKAHDSAARRYGEGERAHRTAYDALKKTHQKVGDHWEQKDGSGPSDPQSAGGRSTSRPTAGGVDTNATKEELYRQAQRLDVTGRSTMSKRQLINALEKKSRSGSSGR